MALALVASGGFESVMDPLLDAAMLDRLGSCALTLPALLALALLAS